MKNSILSIFFVIFFCITLGYSQNIRDVDSVLQKAHSYFKTNQDSALYYANIAYDKSLALNNIKLIAKSIIHKNTYLIYQKKYDEAEINFEYNFKHLDSLDDLLKGDTYYNYGSIKYLKENYDLALENYFTAIRFYENSATIKGLQKSYLQIGVIYDKLSNSELADYFFDKSLAAGKNNHGDSRDLGKTILEKEMDKLNMSKKMLSSIKNKSNSRLAATVYYNMGQSYLYLKDYEKIIETNFESIKIKERINYASDKDKSYAFIGEAYLNLKNYGQAIFYLKKAYNNSTKRQFKLKVTQLLSDAYAESGDYENALQVLSTHNTLKDSLNLIDENKRIAEITARFETKKQAQEIEILEADNNLKSSQLSNQKTVLLSSAIGGLLLLLSLFFAYKNYKTKQNLQFSELTQKLLQMQLNPHFLFNALNGIQYFIKKNDVKKSTKYISNFSGLMRNILENSVEKFITIQEDYDTIKDFLELQQLVNNDGFEYEITIDESLDVDNTCVPPMFTQPFVENAIIHGVSNVKEGKIDVNYKLKNTSIVVEIIDNGKGIAINNANANSLHKSMGTSITKQRMENLLKTERYPVELEVVSKNEENGEQGTKIVLTFPVKYL